jgi:lysophospholipase L1-like esterase
MSLRELAARGLLLAAGSLVAAGTAELLLRAGDAKEDPHKYAAFQKSQTPGLDYEFVPNVRVPWGDREIRTNPQGFRGPDFAEVGRAWPRIAVIGDSIAAGYGVAEDESLPYRLAALMREHGLRGEVLGFGVPGYNIQRITLLWEKKVQPYHPDAVVYAMCLNDGRPELTLSPQGVLLAVETVELSPERARPGRLPIPGKEWLREHSRLYGFAMGRYDVLLRRLGVRAEPLPPLGQVERLYSASPEGRRFRGLLAHLADSVQSSGARFVVVCFPLADQLESHDARPQAMLVGLARTLGIEFVDLYPAFLAAAGGRPQTIRDADGFHPNAAGHALAAQETLTVLRSWIADGAGVRRPACDSPSP